MTPDDTCIADRTELDLSSSSLAATIPLVPLGTSHPAVAHGLSDTATDAKKKPTDPGPVLAVVSLAKQRIWVYGGTGLIAQSPVSTGKPGYRTPAGVFSVVQKRKFHRSNIYWNAPMPYMQRITWSGVTLHAGPVPGYPASHGCIRLPHQFAVKLWHMTKIGARIIVVPNDASVLPIERLELPVPKLLPVPEESDTAAGNARGAGYHRRKSLSATGKVPSRVAQCRIGSSQAAQSAGARQVDPRPCRRRRGGEGQGRKEGRCDVRSEGWLRPSPPVPLCAHPSWHSP